ncbi:unnamed protein product [Moneuplotes crassus]|uniref:Uncharacterized protein n=1 Tax=Euplotes crassus TaxID=5936 RepID=A0AAD1XPI0_EUPCR|nr:unnamed protein product [Moneuplotes crassus]
MKKLLADSTGKYSGTLLKCLPQIDTLLCASILNGIEITLLILKEGRLSCSCHIPTNSYSCSSKDLVSSVTNSFFAFLITASNPICCILTLSSFRFELSIC